MIEYPLPFTVFSIDPAAGLSGWCFLRVESLKPLRIVIVAQGTIDGNKLLKFRKEMKAIYPKSYCVLDAIYDEYCKLLKEYDPDLLVTEGCFAYKYVNAVISLTLAINTFRRAAHHTLNKTIHEITPMESKKAFTGKGNADKDKMREAYFDNKWLIKSDRNDIPTEHEIDATAHGCGAVILNYT
jgi:Holliday junction resolvasome RuvABC endonuclease subunit